MARALSGTLTANEVTDLTIEGAHPHGVHIINRTGTGTIWYRCDGVDPEVAGEGSHPCLSSRRVDNPFATQASGTVVVKLISDVALAYTVEAEPRWVRA